MHPPLKTAEVGHLGDEGTSTLLSLRDLDEEEEKEDSQVSRYKLSLEEVDDLLKAIYTTLEIQDEKSATVGT